MAGPILEPINEVSMSFASRSGVFFFVTATLALAGCSAGGPSPAEADEEPIAESRDAIEEETESEAPECAHAKCQTGEALDPACNPCVADICAVDSFCCEYYWDGLCVYEVQSVCGKQCNGNQTYGKCGDGHCQGNEDCSTCPMDCGFCPPECGNGWCEAGESCGTCSQDCGACPVCGDGVCNYFDETCDSCPQDCTSCGCGDECQVGPAQLASCSACTSQVCAQDPYCCTFQWDAICVMEAQSICGLTCN
jgi:hypothetical protein